MLILGIDTSCDETSVALVEDGVTIRASIVRSQQGLHEEHGGIVPEAASRAHLGAIVPAVRDAMAGAGAVPADVAAIAATAGPGLGGSLMVGLQMAKGLAYSWRRPLLPVNHLEGHVYSAWPAAQAEGRALPPLPVLVLIVSGGHTELILMREHGVYERLGGTRDDAAGEAFDKVGRLLGLAYPGGPAIERAATAYLDAGGTPYPLPQAWLRGTLDFSFSGIKTAVLHLVDPASVGRRPVSPQEAPSEGVPRRARPLAAGRAGDDPERRHGTVEAPREARGGADEPSIGALAAGFQQSVVGVLVAKTVEAARQYPVASVVVAGGVASNGALRRAMAAGLGERGIPLYVPPPALCTDNAAMIAAAGYFRLTGRGAPPSDPLAADVVPGLALVARRRDANGGK
jgi:N6-L-threonylcarbamoyladenine synthase